ncbi:protein neprosin-like [Typha latifolia]|uniref:protein neprosin-like n=1 Tax=Typha latifolia TaxID=4733 RepID=UPI003C2F8F7F
MTISNPIEVRLGKKAILLVLLCIAVVGDKLVHGGRSIPSMEKELGVEKKLKLLNRPAVKTIQSEDGDIIDCVDIYKQPAFDHPLLKDHKIKMKPSEELLAKVKEASSDSPTHTPSQAWRKSGSCPRGTIPMLRVQKHHLLNTTSLEDYGRKPWHGIAKHEISSLNKSYAFGFLKKHEYGVIIGAGYSYLGAKANLNVWNPYVEVTGEYSSSQIWLRNGPWDNADSIEAGWIVHPDLYGDAATRLFVYWTNDSGEKTGCFNLICPGFVQTSFEIALGSILFPVSSSGGPQYHITLTILKEPLTDYWWLSYGNVVIGYWPANIFKGLGQVATIVLFGGDVYSPRNESQLPHTSTAMGSGEFATMHWSHASFVGEPRVMDYSMSFKYPDPGTAYSSKTNCYSAENYAEVRFTEPLFYFGGPGRNMYCK